MRAESTAPECSSVTSTEATSAQRRTERCCFAVRAGLFLWLNGLIGRSSWFAIGLDRAEERPRPKNQATVAGIRWPLALADFRPLASALDRQSGIRRFVRWPG